MTFKIYFLTFLPSLNLIISKKRDETVFFFPPLEAFLIDTQKCMIP